MKLRTIPLRLATGAYILHTGLSKRTATEETAVGLHGMAAGAYPLVKDVPPQQFVKALSVGEMAVGAALLAPFVPRGLAGLLLAGFGGGLVGMYARTPALRQPNSIWPSQQGTAISKDSWLLAIGLSLLLDAVTDRD
ncbi:MAG: hypothetical protein L0H79_15955 [Intrasporangium sp.]|uniref:hypothetical protein n=1 Tax=Intrasporangium sp. TaxID=1925024 RepID=UPI00264800BC|nr:hypothetical protein [Intrasporangium sp.]MDN5797231.1 hypothetical protein [Intrasporangium sp.]